MRYREDVIKCSSCNQPKPSSDFHQKSGVNTIMSRCRTCRSELRYENLYETICKLCLRHRPTDQDGICRKCLKSRGLRRCRRCRLLDSAALSFTGNRAICKSCLRQPSSDEMPGLGRLVELIQEQAGVALEQVGAADVADCDLAEWPLQIQAPESAQD